MSSLSGVKVLDLSRVFSGPWAAQMLADFGADVIKVERPGRGDDVRQQGMRARRPDGSETRETSSFLSMNRGKRSLTIDIGKPEGQALIRQLVQDCDILIENFKAGDLKRYGLDFTSLQQINPRLVYCSISGFGQSGPYSHLPGYDPLFQSMSGLMSVTGHADSEPGGGPLRVGYSVSDITAGFYAVGAILAALRHRDMVSGQGQHIDLALLDSQVAAISHVGMMYLVTGEQPPRLGNVSPITCPWQSFECCDGQIVIAVGNDKQFESLCDLLGLTGVARDERFSTNPQRARNKDILIPMIADVLRTQGVQHWNVSCEAAGVPCGPINNFEQVFADPQIRHREMEFRMEHAEVGPIPQVANPVKFSATPVQYKLPPPVLGQHTDEILRERLHMNADGIAQLRANKVI